MKTAWLPSVRVDEAFRSEVDGVLEEGEKLASLIERAVHREVAVRTVRRDFVQRAVAAAERADATGEYRSADQVIGRLQGILHAAEQGGNKR